VCDNQWLNPEALMEAQEKPSPYNRLGGAHNIATVIDDLIDRIMGDSRLDANPRG
jgi:hypothetical protein